MSLSERIRQAREAAGLSQGQVAKKLEMHRPTISEIEAGRRKVSAQELELFSDLYGVTAEWLLSGMAGNVKAEARILMAARELSKMNKTDLDRLMNTLNMLRKPEKT